MASLPYSFHANDLKKAREVAYPLPSWVHGCDRGSARRTTRGTTKATDRKDTGDKDYICKKQ